MITRLLIAQLIPVALGFLKKAFSKKKSTQLKPNGQRDSINRSADTERADMVDVTPKPQQDVSDQGVG